MCLLMIAREFALVTLAWCDVQRSSDAARKVLSTSSSGVSPSSPSARKESVTPMKESRPTLLTGSALLAIARTRQQMSCTTTMKLAKGNGSKELGVDEVWAAKRCKTSPESSPNQQGLSTPLQTADAVGPHLDTIPRTVSGKELSMDKARCKAPLPKHSIIAQHRISTSAKAAEAAGKLQRFGKQSAGRGESGKVKSTQNMSEGSGLLALVEDDIF